MAIQDNIETMLKTKFDSFMKKYIDARKKFVKKQLEIIKNIEPDFSGSVVDFFRKHTTVSDSTYHQKQHYDITTHKWVNYDVISGDIGIIYDDIGKRVYWQSKKTIEYIVYEYYSKIVFSMINFLNRSNAFGDINVETTYAIEHDIGDDTPKVKK